MIKNKKVIATLVAVALVSTSILNTASAGYWDWTWNGSKGNFVDTNNNWIADGQEDWDNDGILNKDDEDFEKDNINMRDDDGDWIPNKDDEDYVKPEDWTGNKNGYWNKNGSWSMDWQWKMNKNQVKSQSKYVDNAKKSQYKKAIANKYQSKIDSLDTDKLEVLLTKIDDLEMKVEESTSYTEDKKESIINILEALKEIVEERLEMDDVDLDELF